jgi:nitrogen fixation protein FixH
LEPYERAHEKEVRNVDAEPAAKPLTGRTVLFCLLVFFGVIIGINTLMMVLAISTMPGLENERPYQAGIDYNADIEAARAQATRRWKVASHVDRDARGRAAVKVVARDSDGAPLTSLAVTVRLLRPTDQRADRTVSLTERENGSYLGEVADVAPGLWDIELDADRGPERMFRSKNRITLE